MLAGASLAESNIVFPALVKCYKAGLATGHMAHGLVTLGLLSALSSRAACY
jgi:hypothetical protein